MQPDPTPDLDEYGNLPAMLEARYTLGTLGHRAADAISKLIAECRRAARERDELRARAEKAEARAKELEGLYARQCALTDLKDDRAARAEARAKELEDALREAIPHLPDEARESVADRCRQALAKPEGRS